MSLIRQHGAVLQAWACLALVSLKRSRESVSGLAAQCISFESTGILHTKWHHVGIWTFYPC